LLFFLFFFNCVVCVFLCPRLCVQVFIRFAKQQREETGRVAGVVYADAPEDGAAVGSPTTSPTTTSSRSPPSLAPSSPPPSDAKPLLPGRAGPALLRTAHKPARSTATGNPTQPGAGKGGVSGGARVDRL
jgi:hypothetical protein